MRAQSARRHDVTIKGFDKESGPLPQGHGNRPTEPGKQEDGGGRRWVCIIQILMSLRLFAAAAIERAAAESSTCENWRTSANIVALPRKEVGDEGVQQESTGAGAKSGHARTHVCAQTTSRTVTGPAQPPFASLDSA